MGQQPVLEGPQARLSSSQMFAVYLATPESLTTGSTLLKHSTERRHVLFPSLACILSQSHPGHMDWCSETNGGERKLWNMFKEAWDRQLQRLQRPAMQFVSGNVFSSQAVSGSQPAHLIQAVFSLLPPHVTFSDVVRFSDNKTTWPTYTAGTISAATLLVESVFWLWVQFLISHQRLLD